MKRETKVLCAASVLLLVLALLAGCGVNPYDRNEDLNVVHYSVNYDVVTPIGIKVDSSGQAVDVAAIDGHIEQVIDCLTKKFPDGHLPPDVVARSVCRYDTPVYDWQHLSVKVAPDWHRLSEQCASGGMEVFPCSVDPQLCEAKGIAVTADCPCECRSAVLNNSVIVTTPNLYMFDDALIRILTSCNNIWTTSLGECFQG